MLGLTRHPAPRRLGRETAACLALMMGLPSARPADAQELQLKRDLRAELPFECPLLGRPSEPTVDQLEEAQRLSLSASQAAILGERARARDLLGQATRLNPTSAGLAYRYARALEELGDPEAALSEFCRALSVQPEGIDADDARSRLQPLADQTGSSLPNEAAQAFTDGLNLADAAQLEDALASFDRAAATAPEWSTPHYNRGVLLIRLGLSEEAVSSLRRYLDLDPDAADAIRVSERIGQLEASTAAPSIVAAPGAGRAFALGTVPGMGQVYTGRPGAGLTFLSLTGGSALTAFLYERGEGRSFHTSGLAIAGTVTAIGAIDALLFARRLGQNGIFRPDPDVALIVGLIPGMGQFYSGRTETGLALLSLVAGLVAASDLAEDGMDRRFVTPGLVVAGGVAAIGAAEAYFGARRQRPGAANVPVPTTALALGLIPGLGQFYAGRTGMGLAVMSVAASSTAGAFLYEEGEGRGFFSSGLTIAAVAAGLGAIEAYFGARRMREQWINDPFAVGLGSVTLHGPALLRASREVEMRLVGLTF